MSQFLGHLVRRGVDVSYATGRPDGNHDFEMPAAGILSLSVTAVLFLVGICMVDYTYGHLVATLAMVESPNSASFETIPSDNVQSAFDEKTTKEPEVVLVRQKPITSSFRQTILHLRAQAGRSSRFRGISMLLVYQFTCVQLASLFSRVSFIPRGVDMVLATILLARLRTAWVHIAISNPSPKYWFQRIPSVKVWKKIALPTAILAISEHLAVCLPHHLFHSFGLHTVGPREIFSGADDTERQVIVGKFFMTVALGLCIALAIVLPAQIALTRVQASLLPDDQETIVPFDRTLGGKVTPTGAWGCSFFCMLSAWTSFDRNSRIRVIKVYIKVVAMQAGLVIFFAAAVVAQLHFFVGDELKDIIRIGHGSTSDGAHK